MEACHCVLQIRRSSTSRVTRPLSLPSRSVTQRWNGSPSATRCTCWRPTCTETGPPRLCSAKATVSRNANNLEIIVCQCSGCVSVTLAETQKAGGVLAAGAGLVIALLLLLLLLILLVLIGIYYARNRSHSYRGSL